jgi:lipopolysaccharide transport system permease protein
MTRVLTQPATADAEHRAGGAAGDPPAADRPVGGQMAGSVTLAHDVWRSLKHVRLWRFLAWRALVRRYDRTWLGAMWIPVSALVHMLFVGTVFAFIFPGGRFIPHFVLGFAVWSVIARGLNESARLWKSAEKYLKHLNIPVSVFLVQLVAQAAIRLAFILPIALLIAVGFKARPDLSTLWIIPGLLLLLGNLAWSLTLLSVACMKSRDLASFVPNAVFMAYLLTPIIWEPDRLGEHAWMVNFNPFFHMVELIRAPMQGDDPAAVSWIVSIGMVLIGTPIAYAALAATRRRIVLWV